MSLLNQVLQDLEKRQADNSSVIQDSTLLKQVKATRPQATKKYYYLIVALLFILLSVAYGLYLLLPNKGEPSLAEVKAKVLIKRPAITAVIAEPTFKNKPPLKVAAVVVVAPKKVAVQKPLTPVIKQIAKKTPSKVAVAVVVPKKVAVKKRFTPAIKQIAKQPNKRISPITAKHKAEHFFSKAKKSPYLLEQQTLLNKTISLDAKHLNAHLLLANNLLQQGLTNDAIASLQNSLTVFPKNIALSHSLAQLYLQTTQVKLALNTLLSINPADGQNEIFLSLLAAAYQQNNDAKNSLVSYQKLIHINPDKAEYWLGLALAFEQLNQPLHAKTAYQHALNKNSLKANIVSYIKQRMTQLN